MIDARARLFVAIALTSASAFAQAAAPGGLHEPPNTEPQAPPTGDPSRMPPEPPAYPGQRTSPAADSPPHPAVPHGAYVHDGVLLRFSVGPGLFQASTGRSPDDRTYDGGVVSFEGAIGGSVARGFILGGTYQLNRVFSLSATDGVIDGDEPEVGRINFTMHSLSLFADFYPEASEGLHFMALIGEGWLDVARSGTGADGPSPTGPILGAAAGYEWFVGPSLSLGILARANVGLFSVREANGNSTSVTTFVPAIVGTLTYN